MVSAMKVSALRWLSSRTASVNNLPSPSVYSGTFRYLFERTYAGKLQTRMLTFAAVFLFAFTSAWAQVDLSLSKNIDKSKPTIGETIKYTITVKNSGILPATGVVVKDSLPVGGVSYVSNAIVRGTGSYVSATGMWNVGTVAPGDSAMLDITATVLAQGVFFNIAEVVAMN